MDNNDKKVKDMLTSHEIPKELEPESIKTMLDEKADKIHRKKRNGIIKIVSAAAACAVVCTFGVNIIDKKKQIKTEKNENSQINSIILYYKELKNNPKIKPKVSGKNSKDLSRNKWNGD